MNIPNESPDFRYVPSPETLDADVRYRVYSLSEPHCERAREYKDIFGELYYVCRHNNAEVKL